MRDCRATVAIHGLISGQYMDDETASAALLMIEEILQLDGVSEDVLASQRGKRKMSFLNKALQYKNLAAVQLLLKYGADVHHKTRPGHTCLYQATSFKDTSEFSRWLIERGVSIQVRNCNGDYPIHGACRHQSLQKLHLLINLGADLNPTNLVGQTPFGIMKLGKKIAETHQLPIKHFALTIARGGKMNKNDRARIDEYAWTKRYFNKCIKQLEEMKVQKVHSAAPYFSILSKNMYSTMQLVKDQKFIKRFKRDERKRAGLFPHYSIMLSHSFKIATKRLEVLLEIKKDLRKVFMDTLPDSIYLQNLHIMYAWKN